MSTEFKYRVAILMSTFNGERYLKQQLDSLLSQKGINILLIVRDDGSNDLTLEILEKYAQENSFVTILKGSNCGVSKSFDKLCRWALENVQVDFYAFCDQDDVWEDNKLLTAIHVLEHFPSDMPNLYFSNLKMVDENLNFIQNQFKPGEVKTGCVAALVQVFTYGCTCVFNKKALECFCAIPENNINHDHWIYELCTYLGNVYYDEESHIKYRRHSTNVSTIKSHGWSLFVRRLIRLFKGLDHNFDISAKQILFFKDFLKPQDYEYIYKIAHYRENLRYKIELLFSSDYKTGNMAKDLTIKYRILTNKL